MFSSADVGSRGVVVITCAYFFLEGCTGHKMSFLSSRVDGILSTTVCTVCQVPAQLLCPLPVAFPNA